MAGTPEAELHPALADLNPDASLRKGAYAAAYSGFDASDDDGRDLATVLDEARISEVEIVGIAESHCVKATALDAIALGLRTRVLTDLTVPVSPEQGAQARAAMAAAGAELIPSTELEPTD